MFVRPQVQHGVSPELLEDVLGPAVAGYVQRCCERSPSGVGPSWFQVGRDLEAVFYRAVPRPPKGVSDAVRLEWRRMVVTAVMPMLHRAGWVSYEDNVSGSLRPGPRVLPPGAADSAGELLGCGAFEGAEVSA